MRRVLAIFTALAVVLALATPAAAKKGGGHGPPDPPDDPEPPPATQVCKTVTSLAVGGWVRFECDWTPENDWTPGNDGSVKGVVTVTITKGEVTRLVIFVRDSSPGDICVMEQGWEEPIGPEAEASFKIVVGDENYWASPTHWCERFDPIVGPREDYNGEPLHLAVNVRGKRGTEIEISLSPGQAP